MSHKTGVQALMTYGGSTVWNKCFIVDKSRMFSPTWTTYQNSV